MDRVAAAFLASDPHGNNSIEVVMILSLPAWSSSLSLAFAIGSALAAPVPGSSPFARNSSAPTSGPTPSELSAAIGLHEPAYHVLSDHGSLQMVNDDLLVDLSDRRVAVDIDGATFSITLQGLGRGDAVDSVERASPVAVRPNRVEYRRDTVTERYANGPLGVHQEFSILRPPMPDSCEPLTLALAIAGHEQIELDAAADGATLTANDGASVMRYSGLCVFDAEGKTLPSWLELRPSQLLVRVDDREAQYPILVDPWVQKAKLRASDGAANDALGFAVAVSGDTVVVGSPNATINANAKQGAAYVFVKQGANWADMTQKAKLTANGGAADDRFGHAVAVSGDTVVVGSPNAKINANATQGAAYVFVKQGANWADMPQTAKLTSSNGAEADWFGFSVAIEGATVVAGAPKPNRNGEAYVFTKPDDGPWATDTETARLTPSDAEGGRRFGESVGVSGGLVAVGTPGRFLFLGGIYVFVKPNDGPWANANEKARLIASDFNLGHALGTSVAVSGNTVVGGAPGARIGAGAVMGPAGLIKKRGNSAQGAVYVFVEPQNGWAGFPVQTAKLIASDGAAADELGTSVAIDGIRVVAGAPNAKVGNNVRQGAAYLFVKAGNAWADAFETQKLVASDGAAADRFCTSAVSGTTIVVGARAAKIGNNAAQGAAYVFEFETPVIFESYCFGDGSGTACPCGNNSVPGEGCLNSLGFGATLSASGSTSLAANDLVLTCSGMLPSATCTFLQGTQSSSMTAPFTDGLFCVSGQLINMGTVGTRGGTASLTNITLLGGVTPGSTRYYQVAYSDTASFCTPAVQNTSNGISVDWTP